MLLDAASHVSTSPLNLSVVTPDFLTLSFYKLFGFPTGLGALLVRRDSAGILRKPYYGGGTVKATDSWTAFHVAKDEVHDRQVGVALVLLKCVLFNVYRLEDGTIPFLEVLALRHGFATLSRLGRSMEYIQQHTFNLARWVFCHMTYLISPSCFASL